jgi:protein SCO1/2
VAVLIIGLVGLAVASMLLGGSGSRDGEQAAEGKQFRGSEPPVASTAPGFALRDALSGDVVRMADLRGRVVVLTFLESRCESACPLIASQVAAALRRLSDNERDSVVALAISANPRDDIDQSVRAFLRRHRATDQIRYLNGPEGELRRVWEAYQVLSASESGDADIHSAPVRLYGRAGQWLATQHAGADLSVEALVHDISVALDE